MTSPQQMYIRFAVHPLEQNTILELPGISNHKATRIPEPGEHFTHPHFVDPLTHQQLQLIVREVVQYSPDTIAVVLARRQ